jgi:GT2 family glycosyltransferase
MNTNILSKITIVILTYQTDREILYNCLNSIDKEVKIKIIENSNEFKNRDEFLKKFSNLSIDCTGKNLGFGRGNNFGFKKVSTEYVLALSPDTICDKNFFDNLKIYLDNNFDFSILGVNFYKDDIKKSGHLSYGYFKKNKIEKTYNETLLEVDWIIGCAMIINLNKFNDKVVFDENIFIYFEDFDLCLSIKKKGLKVFSSKILFIKHIGNSSSTFINPELKNNANKFRNWHWRWSQFYFYKKNYGYLYAYKKCFFKLIRYLLMMFIFKILFNKNKFDLYKYSFLGLFNSIIGKKSFYRIEY